MHSVFYTDDSREAEIATWLTQDRDHAFHLLCHEASVAFDWQISPISGIQAAAKIEFLVHLLYHFLLSL
jgi:hypothetical protein